MASRRLAVPPPDRRRASEAAAARLHALPAWSAAVRPRGAVIAGFASIRGELDPTPALAKARDAGAHVAYPRIAAAPARPRMGFHVAAPDQLRPGRFGIDEPTSTDLALAPSRISMMLVPGLAFDESGARVGFGGGYYDEWLAHVEDPTGQRPTLVGLAYDFQVVEACPHGDGDARVDIVVTDRRTIVCATPEGRVDLARAPAQPDEEE